jgi:tRNA 2-selenouridine synthase
MRFFVLTGLAGVGKTEVLQRLGEVGEQVVDLELLAGHRGSAFGGIGLPPQPSQRQFDACLEATLCVCHQDQPTWIEDEGPFLGSLSLPRGLIDVISRANTVEVTAARPDRICRLVATYGAFDSGELARATRRLRARLGDDRTRLAARLFTAGDSAAAIDVLLPYFDDAYRHRQEQVRRPRLAVADSSVDSMGDVVNALDQLARTPRAVTY